MFKKLLSSWFEKEIIFTDDALKDIIISYLKDNISTDKVLVIDIILSYDEGIKTVTLITIKSTLNYIDVMKIREDLKTSSIEYVEVFNIDVINMK